MAISVAMALKIDMLRSEDMARDDGDFDIVAGPEGLQAIIMNYPKVVQYSTS